MSCLRPWGRTSAAAGAGGRGGGGFVIAVARLLEAVQALELVPAQRYPGTPVERWESAVPEVGLDPSDIGL